MGVSAPLTFKELSSYAFPSDKWTKLTSLWIQRLSWELDTCTRNKFHCSNWNGILFIYRSHTNNHWYAPGADYRLNVSIDLSLPLSRENTINNSSYKSTRGFTNEAIVCDNVLISKSGTILNKLRTCYDNFVIIKLHRAEKWLFEWNYF